MSATVSHEILAELAEQYGIASSYFDWRGNRVTVAETTLRSVLAALDIDTSTDAAARAALAWARTRHLRRVIPPTLVQRAGNVTPVLVHVPAGVEVHLELVFEDTSRRHVAQVEHLVPNVTVDGIAIGEAKFELPADVPAGWHTLVARIPRAQLNDAAVSLFALAVDGEDAVAEGTVICAPQRSSVSVDSPVWGIMAQLYQARSERSWGLGDLADLRTLGHWGAEHGADFVLVNPFHAPSPVTPIEPSPYLPTSRRFVDPSLINIQTVSDAVDLNDAAANRIDELERFVREHTAPDAIDRDTVWLAKREALGLCFEVADHDADHWREFGDYLETQGQGLIDFATWCALCEQHGWNWRDWPAEFHNPGATGVDEFRQENADRIQFYCWLQFVVNEQATQTQRALTEAGMKIGVMHDLAVGVHPSGADAWSLDESLARGVSVGAPPDAFNQLGQDWSQPPLRPDALERTGYAPLRDMLRAAFTGAGALRIDHILGMFRLWWIPSGSQAGEGTYVTYNHEAMIGVLLLEAERANALVIGEDLGVVSDLTRQVMAERHVYGTQIMWFERDDTDAPKPPREYRKECLATVTTHDLPPTAGYLELEHVRVRHDLGLLSRSLDEELEAEREVVASFVQQVADAGLLDAGASTDDTVIALHRYLAGSVSKLFGVALADLAGDRRSINQPGTFREYPNWTLPIAGPDRQPLTLEQVLASPHAERIAAASQRQQ
nr:4-alpha-glucanotransferase [Pseudoclavibacter sp. Marseille-Q3772]